MKHTLQLLLLILLLAACGGAGSAPDQSAPSYDSGASGVAPEEPPAGEMEAARESMPPPEGGGGSEGGADVAQAQANRKIIYTGYLQIRSADARVMANQIQGIATRFGGYVSQENVYESNQEGIFQGEVQIRVTSDKYNAAMEELRRLGDVLNEQSETSDVTDQYVDIEARINNLKRTESEIQALLAESRQRGASTEDILNIYQELTSIREQIEVYQGQLNVLADQTSLATINVSMVPPQAEVKIIEEGWSFTRILREAARDFTRTLQGMIEAGVYFLVAVLPWLLVWGLILYFLIRALRWLAGKVLGSAPRPQTIPPLRDGATVIPAPREPAVPVQPRPSDQQQE